MRVRDGPDITVDRFWQILTYVPEPMQPIYVLMVGTGVEPGVMPTATLARERQALVVVGRKKGRQGPTVIPLSPELWAYAQRAVPCDFTSGYLFRVWKRAAVGHAAQDGGDDRALCQAAGSGGEHHGHDARAVRESLRKSLHTTAPPVGQGGLSPAVAEPSEVGMWRERVGIEPTEALSSPSWF